MQRDVVLRWIEQIALVIRRILFGPGKPDLVLARNHLDEAMQQLLGPLATLVPQLDARSAVELLHDPERVQGLALLLELEAELASAQGDEPTAATLRERAAAFRELVPHE